MNEKEKITQFLREFKIGDYMCDLHCTDENKWINIYGNRNDIVFDTLNIEDRDSFVRKFYNPSDSLCQWPPMDKDDDIENMLKLVFELYLRYEFKQFKQLHIEDCFMKIDVCRITFHTKSVDYLCKRCTSFNPIWSAIKYYILKNQDFPQVTFQKDEFLESNCSNNCSNAINIPSNENLINIYSDSIKNYIDGFYNATQLKGEQLKEKHLKSEDNSDAVRYSGHIQITINKGKKKFKIPTKI